MAILRLKEIQAMSPEDRTKKLGELRTELSRIKTMINAGGAIENPTRGRELRKTVAQILTIQNEDKLGIRKPAKEQKEKPKKKTESVEKKSKAKKETEETVSK
jgi:large subunit ribosomal protein L29